MEQKIKTKVKPPEKFTQEIKDKWLEALKSGKYKQGFCSLYREQDNSFCCIGVLGDVIEGLDNSHNSNVASSPYAFLNNTIGDEKKTELYIKNDDIYFRPANRDYSNVIPLIEKLPVQD